VGKESDKGLPVVLKRGDWKVITPLRCMARNHRRKGERGFRTLRGQKNEHSSAYGSGGMYTIEKRRRRSSQGKIG